MSVCMFKGIMNPKDVQIVQKIKNQINELNYGGQKQKPD